MTTGERIAQKRKELGLSQEQLGTELGVSRQAIYKWESDAALPEIEKLVALSQRFGVAVGWLLGVEDERAEDAEPASSEELTAAQLRMVEEIASRYQRPQSHGKRWPYLLFCAIALVLILSLIGLKREVNTVSGNYGDLQMAMNRMEWEMQRQIDSMSDRVATTLTEQNSLTEIVTIGATGNLAENEIILSVMAVPKTSTDSMTAIFTVTSGGETTEAEGVRSAGAHFSAEIPCRLSDDMRVTVTFVDGETRQTQELAYYDNAYSTTLPYAWVPMTGFFDGSYTKCVHDVYVQKNESPFPLLECAEAAEVRLGLFCDHKLVRWMTPCDTLSEKTLRTEFPGDNFNKNVEGLHQFANLEAFPIDTAKTYQLVIVLRDKYGREAVYPSGEYVYTDHGNTSSWDSEWPAGELADDPANWQY